MFHLKALAPISDWQKHKNVPIIHQKYMISSSDEITKIRSRSFAVNGRFLIEQLLDESSVGEHNDRASSNLERVHSTISFGPFCESGCVNKVLVLEIWSTYCTKAWWVGIWSIFPSRGMVGGPWKVSLCVLQKLRYRKYLGEDWDLESLCGMPGVRGTLARQEGG